MIQLKSRREIERMRLAGRLVAEAHSIARSMCQPGIRTIEIENELEALFAKHNARPLFKGYPGEVPFPAVTCISVNEEVVHGIPGPRVLREGDIVSIDTGCELNGWCGDSAWTYPVGKVNAECKKLLEVGEAVLMKAIEQIQPGKKWYEVAAQMEKIVHAARFSLVEDFVGHGIGKEMHEEPQVPNYQDLAHPKENFRLQVGMVLAIEPMINAGTKDVGITDDYWTVITLDGKPSVHFEHTVAVTTSGADILTLPA
jgi:methionyl aminopeptidase